MAEGRRQSPSHFSPAVTTTADSVTQLSFSAEPSLECMFLEGRDLTFHSLRGPNAWTVPGMQPTHTEYLGSTVSTVSPEPPAILSWVSPGALSGFVQTGKTDLNLLARW